MANKTEIVETCHYKDLFLVRVQEELGILKELNKDEKSLLFNMGDKLIRMINGYTKVLLLYPRYSEKVFRSLTEDDFTITFYKNFNDDTKYLDRVLVETFDNLPKFMQGVIYRHFELNNDDLSVVGNIPVFPQANVWLQYKFSLSSRPRTSPLPHLAYENPVVSFRYSFKKS